MCNGVQMVRAQSFYKFWTFFEIKTNNLNNLKCWAILPKDEQEVLNTKKKQISLSLMCLLFVRCN